MKTIINKYVLDIIETSSRGGRFLELGCHNADMTEEISKLFTSGVAIDYKKPRRKVRNVSFISCDLDKWNETLIGTEYDFIIACQVLEHVKYPYKFLIKMKRSIHEDGRVLILTPNKESLNRRIGKEMGIIKRLDELTKADIKHGHRRLYNLKQFTKLVKYSGLDIEESGGILIKPFDLKKMSRWPIQVLDGLNEIAKYIPEYSGLMYVLAKR